MKYLLIPFSIIYYVITYLRNVCYDLSIINSHSIKDAKVISIGNITWGGTGKTPVTLYIAKTLLNNNKKPVVLLRGYGKDEKMLYKDIPLVIGKDRVKTGNIALKKYFPDTILLDDGFQHRRLKRDLNIVCIDAQNPFGNNLLIPSGSLREGLYALKRADIFIITKSNLVNNTYVLEARLKTIAPNTLIIKAIHVPEYFHTLKDNTKLELEDLKYKDVALVSGIGSPNSFKDTISNLGINVKKHFIFRDHHLYSTNDIKNIDEYCQKNNIKTLITTEKDFVKIKPKIQNMKPKTDILILKITLRIINDEERLFNRLIGIYNS